MDPTPANELGHLANGVGAGMPSGTDTIRIMKHTDLPAGCNSTYVVGIKSHCHERSLHWLQHRLPMLRTSSHEKLALRSSVHPR
jgi:hypothetical protein